jgi:hypothetical protein
MSTQPVTYLAVYNVPGYSPEMAAIPFDTADEAWEYLWGEHDLALFNVGQDVPAAHVEAFAAARKAGHGSVTLPTPGYTGDHDLGVAYTVERFEGVVCADCGARFTDTDTASEHWLAAHLEAGTP